MNWILIMNVALLAAQLYLVGLLWRKITKFEQQVKQLAEKVQQ